MRRRGVIDAMVMPRDRPTAVRTVPEWYEGHHPVWTGSRWSERRTAPRVHSGFVRKWLRRFFAQHASVCSRHAGRSSP